MDKNRINQVNEKGLIVEQFWAGDMPCCVRFNPHLADGWGGYEIRTDSRLRNTDLESEYRLTKTPVPKERQQDGTDVTDLVLAFAREQQAKEIEKKRKREAVFRTARETGERQVLGSWMDECNDPTEQCSLDSCTEYAMPDGSTRVERMHTW